MRKSKMGRPSLGGKPPCSMEFCEGTSRSHETRICPACYQSLRYHVKLGPVHVFHWQQRMAKWGARANSVGAKPARLRAVAGGRR